MKTRVIEALEEIRPFLMADGGDAEVVDITRDGRVKIRLLGACSHCPVSLMTLRMGIEKTQGESPGSEGSGSSLRNRRLTSY